MLYGVHAHGAWCKWVPREAKGYGVADGRMRYTSIRTSQAHRASTVLTAAGSVKVLAAQGAAAKRNGWVLAVCGEHARKSHVLVIARWLPKAVAVVEGRVAHFGAL